MARQRTLLASGIAALAIIATSLLGAVPATADSLPAADCVVACTATFNTPDSTGLYVIPVGVTSVTVTVAGGAGDVPAAVSSLFPGSVGGAGGVSTVELGPSYGGTTLGYTVGGVGGASGIASSGSILLAAGGGGGAGYQGRLDLLDPDQISAVYPGGAGGAPTAAGWAAGGDGTAPTANGTGSFGPTSGHTGVGTVASGGEGTFGATVIASVPNFGAGGAGATAGPPSFAATHTAGSGGSGAGGGGGGGLSKIDVDEITYGVVGAGGGGAGFLADGLTAIAGTNLGTGYVTISWSYSPTITTTKTTVQRGEIVDVAIAGLPASRAFNVVWNGITVLSTTSDAAGTATLTFPVAPGQQLGTFALQLSVGGSVVATSSPIQVAALLASTGTESIAPAIVGGSMLLIGLLAVIGVAFFRRRAEGSSTI